MGMRVGTIRQLGAGIKSAGLVFLMLLILALAPDAASAQQYQFSNVRVEGNQRIETPTILSYVGISRGETVTAAQLNDAAQRIRSTGLFESVDVVPQGGTLFIRVTEFPTINRINFEGNRRLRDEELSAIVSSQSRRVLSPLSVEQDVAAITQAYAADGRIAATVDARIIERSDNRVDLVFEIFEGGVTEIERISFVGNRTFSDGRLRRVLQTKQAGIFRSIVSRDTLVEDRIAFDRQVLTDFYRSRGYVDFTVQNVDVQLTRERDAFLITFNVQEGQQFRIGTVTVSSELADVDPEGFERVVRLRSGIVYAPNHIDDAISRLEIEAIRRGLNFVRVEPRISRNDRDLTLDVEFVLARGERVFVERIDIEGNTTTLDRVIRRQFDTVEGDPFNPRLIRAAAERIRALGFFRDTRVDAREGSQPGQVVIDVDVEEQPTGSFSFGANYSSDNGFGLTASFSERNFLGRGQLLSLNLLASGENQTLGLRFAEPAFLGRDLRFSFDGIYEQTDNNNALYDTRALTIRPAFTFPVSENGRLSVRYSYEFTEIFDVSGTTADAPADRASLLIFEEADEGLLSDSSIGYSYSYDTRRSGFNPTGGFVFRFGQDYVGLGGDREFVRTSLFAGVEGTIFNEDVTLRGVLEAGALSFPSGENSRVTDRYFLGSSVMRGFEPGGIGPRDADTDDALGGNFFAVARLEAEFPLGLPEEYGIRGGAFVDYGSVWDVGAAGSSATILYDEFTPRTVVGLSLFWDTPVGPLRFNWTEAIEAEEFDRPRNFDVTISTQF